MPVAHKHAIHILVSILDTMPDSDALLVKSSDDEQGFREVIRRFVKPYVYSFDEDSIGLCKDSLRYYLNTNSISFEDVFSNLQDAPIPYANNDRDFFVWVWEELFPNEDFKIESFADWKTSDVYPTIRYRNPFGIV